MKLEKQIEDFIQLRIEGKSFDEIAKELKTSKSTLIAWNKKVDVRNEITEGKAIALNNIVKAFAFDKQTRLKSLLQLSKKINDELLKRDLTDISTDTLLKMSIANDSRITGIVNNTFEFGSNQSCWEVGINEDGFFRMQLDE
jgi:hypothetical protein